MTVLRYGLGRAAAVLLLAFCFADPAGAAEVKRFELTIAGRALTSGNDTLQVTQGDRVELVWQSDEDVELHLHGYDVEAEVAAGTPAVMAFTATASGRFPIGSHGFGGDHAERVLAYLEVYPD